MRWWKQNHFLSFHSCYSKFFPRSPSDAKLGASKFRSSTMVEVFREKKEPRAFLPLFFVLMLMTNLFCHLFHDPSFITSWIFNHFPAFAQKEVKPHFAPHAFIMTTLSFVTAARSRRFLEPANVSISENANFNPLSESENRHSDRDAEGEGIRWKWIKIKLCVGRRQTSPADKWNEISMRIPDIETFSTSPRLMESSDGGVKTIVNRSERGFLLPNFTTSSAVCWR